MMDEIGELKFQGGMNHSHLEHLSLSIFPPRCQQGQSLRK